MSNHLSPRKLAKAVGVSESSIKRWVDAGRIASTVTAGGHRRIPLEAALRFVRETGADVTDPGALGIQVKYGLDAGAADALYGHILRGRAREAVDLVRALYASGMDTPGIIDGPFRTAMARLGMLWHDRGEEGIFLEHRATQIGLRIIQDLRFMQGTPRASAMLAIGGAPEGDPYILPSLAVATVLESAGFATSNLGPETPDGVFVNAIENLRPDLVWFSLTSFGRERERVRSVRTLAEVVVQVGGSLVVGGQASEPLHGSGFRIDSMVELAAFARGMLQRGRRAEEEGS
jgi:excisionase family DNA binding protein